MTVIKWLSDHSYVVASSIIGLVILILVWVDSLPPIEKHITLEPGYKYVGCTFHGSNLYITKRPMRYDEYPESYVVAAPNGGTFVYYIEEDKRPIKH